MLPDHRVTLRNKGGDYHNAIVMWKLTKHLLSCGAFNCSVLFDAKEVVYFKSKSMFPFGVKIITLFLAPHSS